MPAHDIIDNRKQKLVDHLNHSLSSTEAAKRQNPAADTSGLEAEIDGLVYALYPPSPGLRRASGLTPAEIKSVEDSTR